MLNLKELEQKLDNALAKETTESLSNWLSEKRINNTKQSDDDYNYFVVIVSNRV